tara:strand:+ start:283 stop:474 length:192 start_codon:yes stop_codon:yes gene_type:complete
MKTLEILLNNNTKKELTANSLEPLTNELVLEILAIALKNSLDDDAKKRQDLIRASIKNSLHQE